TATVTLQPGTGYNVGAAATASAKITDDDRTGLQLSNYTLSQVAPPSNEPNDVIGQATDLGLAVPGQTVASGPLTAGDHSDWHNFRIDRAAANPESITSLPGPGVSFGLELYNSSNFRIGVSYSFTGPLDLSSLPSGDYTLRASAFSPYGSYSFQFHGSD